MGTLNHAPAVTLPQEQAPFFRAARVDVSVCRCIMRNVFQTLFLNELRPELIERMSFWGDLYCVVRINRNSVLVRKTRAFSETKATLLNTINADNSHITLMIAVDCSVFRLFYTLNMHMVTSWTTLIGGFVVLFTWKSDENGNYLLW